MNEEQKGQALLQLSDALEQFLAEDCSGICLDEDSERQELAGKIVHWLFRDKSFLESPETFLPKAKYHLGFNVVDEANGEHIIRLVLDRLPEMADGDFLQLQNFFWTVIGRSIRDNPDTIKTLEAGGVRVEVDPPVEGGGQQFAS